MSLKRQRIATKRRRANVIQRYGYPTICILCGAPLRRDQRSNLDHIMPRSLGGTSHVENLRIVHDVCNSTRGNRLSLADVEQLRERGQLEVYLRPLALATIMDQHDIPAMVESYATARLARLKAKEARRISRQKTIQVMNPDGTPLVITKEPTP